jgi:molecular chaperone Hsp33
LHDVSDNSLWGNGGDRVRGPDDLIQPFTLEASGVRGRLVRVGPVLDQILGRHAYPTPVARLLGEMVTLAGLLSAMLKYDGVFTLQTSGDGPVSMVVVDFTSEGAVRAWAQYDADAVAALPATTTGENADVIRLLGTGQLAFTVDHEHAKERYQGIVELQGRTLAECLQHYFHQSEQIASSVRLSARTRTEGDGATRWRAGGLLLQRLPEEAGVQDLAGIDEEDAWRRAVILMSSTENAELSDPVLTPNELLFRLFNEEGVRVFHPTDLSDRCRCSREKVERVLAAMPRGEIEDLKLPDGTVDVTCQFCSRSYIFTDTDLGQLYGTDA